MKNNYFLKKKKTIIQFVTIVCIGLLLFSACEKDDFCLDNPVTPRLVIRFYDNINRDIVKRVDRLSIFIESAPDSIFKEQNTDSISIPLNPTNFLSDEITSTTFVFRTEDETVSNENKEAKITIEYIPQRDYVSRSCGFRIIFNDVEMTATVSGWIDEIDTENLTTIDNQNAAHVQIFH